jgi:carbon starvation protein
VFAVTLGVAAGRYDADQNFRLVAGPASLFASGIVRFLNDLGLPSTASENFAVTVLALLPLSVMPVVVRFFRQVSAELLGERFPPFRNRYFGAASACLAGIVLLITGLWPWLWALFGSASQLLAGISLLVASIWLAREGTGSRWLLWTSVFIFVTGLAALLYVALYSAGFQGILLAGETNPGILIGNVLTLVTGVFFTVIAIVLFITGWQTFRQVKS